MVEITIKKDNLKKILNKDNKFQNKIYCYKCKLVEEILEIHYDPTDKVNLISINEYYVTCSNCKTNWNAFIVSKCKKCLKNNSFYTRKNMLVSGGTCQCENIYWI